LGAERNVRSRSFGGDDFPAPIPGQQLVDMLGWMIGQACEHVGEPGLWIDVVELGGGDQRVDGSGAPTAFVGACEGPVFAPHCDGAQFALGGVVRHAQSAVVEEARECRPALEAVVYGFPGLAALGDPGALLAQPSLQLDGERSAALLARADRLLRSLHRLALLFGQSWPARPVTLVIPLAAGSALDSLLPGFWRPA
jgi:hypothetical protein